MSDTVDALPPPLADSGVILHVIPLGDAFLHTAQTICWCHPVETTPGVWAHNAKDCREAFERITGERKRFGWVRVAQYVR